MEIKPNICISNIPQPPEFHQYFELSQIDGIPCAYCGNDMPSVNFLNKFFRSDSQTDTQLLRQALKLRYILPPHKQKVLDTLAEIQVSQGLTTDNQVLANAKVKATTEAKEDVLKRFAKIVAIIAESDDKRLLHLMAQKGKKYEEMINKNPSYSCLIDFVKKNLYDGYFNCTHNETHSKILEVLSDIENDGDTYKKNRILRKIIFYKAKEFYIGLFAQTISTTDHIVPKSKGGDDNIWNFLSVCKNCNNRKGNTLLPLFIKANPEVKDNIEKQLRFLKKVIPALVLKRKLDMKYLDYPEEVNKTLSAVTDGTISLIA